MGYVGCREKQAEVMNKVHERIQWAAYPIFLMAHLIEAATTIFDDISYDEMWEAGLVHFGVFESSEWCKGEQTEYMEMLEYIKNELKSVLR